MVGNSFPELCSTSCMMSQIMKMDTAWRRGSSALKSKKVDTFMKSPVLEPGKKKNFGQLSEI